MNHRTAALALTVVLMQLVAACDDELETRPAAYPTAIGYTPPPSQPPPPPPETSAGAAVSPNPGLEPGAGGAAYGPEVTVGGDEEEDTENPGAPAGAPVPSEPEGAGAPDANGSYADTDPSALSDFRPTLDPYGSWVDDPTYGTAWVPSPDAVGADFTPYVTGGHWAYDDDYTWVSDYGWGWAPFHYGRWVNGGMGWEWIPGRRYAGAWVSWRYGAGGFGYVGWAPLAPRWGWRGGVAVGLGFAPRAPYAFVSTSSLFAPTLAGRAFVGPRAAGFEARTVPWSGGPSARGGGVAVGGPPPAMLNIRASAVVHTTAGDRGVAQARGFARPSSAIALGARPPVAASYRSAPSALRGGAEVAPSHFGGRFGAGFHGDRAAPYSAPRTLTGRGAGAPYSAPRPEGIGRPAAGPAYRGASPAPARGGGGFRGGGGGGFRGGGGGGFHGGGGGGGHGGRR
jgi:hypothetical protein